MQMVCWGVRNMASFQLLSVKSPSVEISLGDVTVQSNVITNTDRNPNFDEPLVFRELVSAPVVLFVCLFLFINPHPEWWGAGMVICLEGGADLHMAQLMPLPLTVSCFSECVCVYVRACVRACVCVCSSIHINPHPESDTVLQEKHNFKK